MGGRITGIAVYEPHPSIFYVASASGGLFKTENNGTTFSPVFEREGTVSLGAVAVSDKDPNIVWVGTGEGSSRNSVSWGDGVYKSLDGGKSWKHMGLVETMQIGKIVIDPKDPNVVYVAALGRLWGYNQERGLYKTTDGGKTWNKILYIDDHTGAIDIAMDPTDHRRLIVALWERLRKPWDFSSGGPSSGLFKTDDAGRSFHHLWKGLPTYSHFGRIGISYFRKNPKVVIATIEYKRDPKKETDKAPLDAGVVKNYAGGTFRSTDGGETWKKINPLNPRPFYFSLPVQDPTDPNRIYVLSDSMWLSDDEGKTFQRQRTRVHPDFHAFWVDPADDTHILAGCDGGLYTSYDRAKTWEHINNFPIGQYYQVAVDMRQPYWIYGGLQDNACWGIPTQTREAGIAAWSARGLDGGDGFYCQVDPTDWRTVYTESQNGGITRNDLETGQTRYIHPDIASDEHLRFNWCTPYILSPQNPRTLYMGANRLLKSVNRGDSWRAISPDLTTNNKEEQSPGKDSITPEDTGAEAHCTIVTISASPIKEGLIYVGTDDGQVQITDNDGATWTNLTTRFPDLPANTWCSRVVASKWAVGRAYATFDGHRSNDFKPYVFVTEDFGKTWNKLNSGLPEFDCINVIREGEKNSDLLYLGSEMSLRFSLDRGKSWSRFRTGWPTVAVDDLLVHPRDLDLVIGTHGRSVWTIDVSPLEGLNQEKLKDDVVLTTPQDVIQLGAADYHSWNGDKSFVAPNTQPETRIYYYLRQAPKGQASIRISDVAGKRSQTWTEDAGAGLNVHRWNDRLNGAPMPPGDYQVSLTIDGKSYTTAVHVVGVANSADPRANERHVDDDDDQGDEKG
jgi:photosystem II stability/assembly factor-like uncharacterized protein